MARYTGPKVRISRRFNEPIMGESKVLAKKNYAPGQHGKTKKRKLSEYATQLAEKQKAKYIYGVLERQFENTFDKATRKKGVTGEVLLQLLEARLDNTVYRLGVAPTRRAARQLVVHKHIFVNGDVVNIPSFTFKPVETGYGVTIGNALRRILLSSLEGYAITGIKIPGVLHECSTIEGVVEDVAEIILNLKQVRFRKIGETNETKGVVNIKKQKQFKAGDIAKFTSGFEILNGDHVICNLDESSHFEIELTIEKGRGYLPAEENKPNEQVFGFIPIDAIFTPIKNVKYSVENTRVEQKTDYEKLMVEIETDGSIHPEKALEGAAFILIQHFRLFSDKSIELETSKDAEVEQVDEEMLHMRKLLKTQLHDLDLSVRAYNCLKAADVKTLGDLVQLDISDMMKFRNFGKKSLAELEQLVSDKNLTFGMDLAKYKLEED